MPLNKNALLNQFFLNIFCHTDEKHQPWCQKYTDYQRHTRCRKNTASQKNTRYQKRPGYLELASIQPRSFYTNPTVVIIFLLSSLLSGKLSADSSCPVSDSLNGCVIASDIGSTVSAQRHPLLVQGNIDPINAAVYHVSVDYQDSTSKLMLARHYVGRKQHSAALNSHQTDSALQSPWGKDWRSTYDISLRRQSPTELSLTQSNGVTLRFSLTASRQASYLADTETSGFITHQSPYYRWHRPDGSTVVFLGPIPVRFEFRQGDTLTLHYQRQRLHSVKDQHGQRLTFHYATTPSDLQTQSRSPVSHIVYPNGSKLQLYFKKGYLVKTKLDGHLQGLYRYTDSQKYKRLASIHHSSGIKKSIRYDTNGYPTNLVNHESGVSSSINMSHSPGRGGITTVRQSTGESARLSWSESGLDHGLTPASFTLKPCPTCPTQTLPLLVQPRSSAQHQQIHPVPVQLDTGLWGLVTRARHGINTFQMSAGASALERAATAKAHRQLLSPIIQAVLVRNNSQGADSKCPVILPGPIPDLLDNDTEESSTECDAEGDRTPSIPGAQFRDIKTADCESFFERYSGITRGIKLESAIATHEDFESALFTSRRFPVVDFVIDRTAVISKSRDLTSVSYTSSRPLLYQTLLRDAATIATKFIEPLETPGYVSATEGGITTTIKRDDVDRVVYEITVRHGTATDFQMLQLEKAKRDMLDRYGIELQVVEIP